MRRFFPLAVLALMLLPLFAQAQGCAMCYAAAAQQSEAGKKALDAGILLLLTPAVSIFCGVFYFAWKHRDDEESF